MRLETKSHGESYISDESNICDLNWGSSGLRIVVEFWKRSDPANRRFIEYYWHGFTRHRVLEESDLAHYWDDGNFENDKFLYEVISGGWISNAPVEKINLWCGREWFVYTSNMSATIIASNEPLVRELK